MKPAYRILTAQPEHLEALPEIERAAASIFPEEVLPKGMEIQTTSISSFEVSRQGGLLWVAVTMDDMPVGFAQVEDHGDTLHLEELDVHPDHQKQGIGKTLLETVSKFAREAGYQGITLTTFSNIPWNGPWYERMGFRVLKPEELSSELRTILLDEAQRGLDPASRVAMMKNL